METEQTSQKQTKSTEKCTCGKALAELKKEVSELKSEIELLRLVLRSVK
jgi:hypothetical protein